MPIVWLTEQIGFFPGPVNIGLLRHQDRVLMVDAGLDDGSARKLLRELQPAGLRPAALFLTHHHADHTGGAPRLVREGAQLVAASPLEASLMRHPYWEPYAFCGGAHPPAVLRKKFLLPPAVNVTVEVQPGPWEPDGWGGLPQLEIVPLPGHTPGQVGLRAGDVLFCGDCLLPAQTWEKYGLAYFADMARSLDTCRSLALLAADLAVLVPGHGSRATGSREILERIEVNRLGIEGLIQCVRRLLAEARRQSESSGGEKGLSLEDLLEMVLGRLGLTPVDVPEYFLNRGTVQAVLTYLSEKGEAEAILSGTRLLWQATSGTAQG